MIELACLVLGLTLGMLGGSLLAASACTRVLVEAGQRESELEAEVARLESWIAQGDSSPEPTEVPDVYDSPAWGARQVDLEHSGHEAKLDDALARVLAYGDKLRRCAVCREPHLITSPVNYAWRDEQVWVEVHETCQSCGATLGFSVRSQAYVCMEAMRVWEGCRTATALFRSEQQSLDEDLAELDALPETPEPETMRSVAMKTAAAKGIAVALMRCVNCKRWLEPRDGTAACDCSVPMIEEG